MFNIILFFLIIIDFLVFIIFGSITEEINKINKKIKDIEKGER
mgnify:CR=1 FL=1